MVVFQKTDKSAEYMICSQFEINKRDLRRDAKPFLLQFSSFELNYYF